MKTELKARFLQHLIPTQSNNSGFTLLELLVVIIIIGILSAIALPSFLNQANKARQSEAAVYVGTINRGQQAYYLEKNQFGALSNLELGVRDSKNYTYASTPSGAGFTISEAITTATPILSLKGYAGRVWLGLGSDNNFTTLAIHCEGKGPGAANMPNMSGRTACP